MRARVVTVVYAVLLAAWFLSEEKQINLYSQGVYDVLHSAPVEFGFVVSAVLVGVVVGRAWVLLALIGPLLLLTYLQLTGYLSPWNDGASPLSLANIVRMIWIGLFLLLGVGIQWARNSASIRRTGTDPN